jgi:signal transduction histidine kinase
MINGNVRRNLFLSVKESLHNIVKHAQASQVKIEISMEKPRDLHQRQRHRHDPYHIRKP